MIIWCICWFFLFKNEIILLCMDLRAVLA